MPVKKQTNKQKINQLGDHVVWVNPYQMQISGYLCSCRVIAQGPVAEQKSAGLR